MEKETRIIRYDRELQLEAYSFEGVMQSFANHSHDYYVIGVIEAGQRNLVCNRREYTLVAGDLLLFNPRDNHACRPVEEQGLTYRCMNIQPEILRQVAGEITGEVYLPYFTGPVIPGSELSQPLLELHQMLMAEERDFRKEELFFFLMEQLIAEHTERTPAPDGGEPSAAIQAVCAYLEERFAETIALEKLGQVAGLSKYYLLRCFTRQKGISPYRYLETIRIDRAKRLLEGQTPPMEVALLTGFSDQSHFTNVFREFIGLTPRQYMGIFRQEKE